MKRPAVLNTNGGTFKKSKQETDSSGVGSKTKACTKFFSTAGCPFGDSCHFLHNVAGGYHTVSQMMNLGPHPASRPITGPPIPNGSTTPSVKKKLCNKYNTAEGCKFGDKCSFAHGEWELGKPMGPVVQDMGGALVGPYSGRDGPPVPAPAPVLVFGAFATAKINVEASLAGPIIGKAGVNSKQICRQTGVKLSIRDHETDSNLRNIELEGTFDQIKEASAMVRELISSIGPQMKASGLGPGPKGHVASNYKTKLCDNFAKGSCTFGDKCHFAHGASELQKAGM